MNLLCRKLGSDTVVHEAFGSNHACSGLSEDGVEVNTLLQSAGPATRGGVCEESSLSSEILQARGTGCVSVDVRGREHMISK